MAQRNLNKKMTRLRIILNERGIMQKDLAQMAGVEVYQISKICSGANKNIMLPTAKKISKALGLNLEEVFGDDDDDK